MYTSNVIQASSLVHIKMITTLALIRVCDVLVRNSYLKHLILSDVYVVYIIPILKIITNIFINIPQLPHTKL
jgi:hypothetical protein